MFVILTKKNIYLPSSRRLGNTNTFIDNDPISIGNKRILFPITTEFSSFLPLFNKDFDLDNAEITLNKNILKARTASNNRGLIIDKDFIYDFFSIVEEGEIKTRFTNIMSLVELAQKNDNYFLFLGANPTTTNYVNFIHYLNKIDLKKINGKIKPDEYVDYILKLLKKSNLIFDSSWGSYDVNILINKLK